MRNGNKNYHQNNIATLFAGLLVAWHSFCEKGSAEKCGMFIDVVASDVAVESEDAADAVEKYM